MSYPRKVASEDEQTIVLQQRGRRSAETVSKKQQHYDADQKKDVSSTVHRFSSRLVRKSGVYRHDQTALF